MPRTRLDQLKTRPEFMCGRPATDAEIAAIERAIGVGIPDSYRAFLRTFGFALWDGDALYGVFDDADGELEGYDFGIVALTTEARKVLRRRRSKLPFDRMFAVSSDDAGGYFLMDARDVGEGIRWVTEDDYSVPAEEWPTFDAFLAHLLAKPT